MKTNQALRPQFILYSADGQGRDLYISSNSGGFCKKYSHGLEVKENYPSNVKFKYANVGVHPAPMVYRSDGSGRDSYILREAGGLRKEAKSLKSIKLSDFLR